MVVGEGDHFGDDTILGRWVGVLPEDGHSAWT